MQNIYNYYIKKIYYGDWVKNILLPMECLNKMRNVLGIKNIGNTEKLRHNNVRTQCRFIQKALHNFYNSKLLSFVTLTYTENMGNVKQSKRDIRNFFRCLKQY